MKNFRFKTKEEFIIDGLWDYDYDVPNGWDIGGNMNGFLGRELHEFYLEECEAGEYLHLDGWTFCPNDYVEISDEGFKPIEETVMEVSGNGNWWTPRVVFGKKGGYYLAWTDAKTLEESFERYSVDVWKYARPVKTKLTLKQVAEKFGLKEDEIEIIES